MAKNVKFNAAAGLFGQSEPAIEVIEDNTKLAQTQIEVSSPEAAPTAPADPEDKKKAKSADSLRRSFSFLISDDLDSRLLRFVTERKLKKEKITKTDVIFAALEEYLSRHESGD